MDKENVSILLVLLVFWGGPRVFESAETACHATEKRVSRMYLKDKFRKSPDNIIENIGISLFPAISRGNLVEEGIRQKSDIPTFIMCPLVYWRTYLPEDMPFELPVLQELEK